jgi:hypothetical protein
MADTQDEKVNAEQTETFIPDGAVSDPNLDRFRRWPFAQRIAQTIATRQDPTCIVIGIYGAWGEGKTTVLNFIQHELKQSSNIIPVKFNPWRYGDEVTLLRSFFKTLADALQKSLSTKGEKIGEWLEQYASILSPLSFTLGGGIIGVSPADGIRDFGKTLSSVDLETLKERIEKFLENARARVVILMDDIDRLDKIEINNVFKLIKLTADFSYTAYILAFDNRMVAAALRENYVSAEIDAGDSFLDKIIQVPLHLPKADTIALRKLCFEGVDQAIRATQIPLTQDQINEFVRHFIDGLEVRLQTPRSAKRYSNALLFALPILKGEVNLIDLMLIEGVRVFYPRLYIFIRTNPNLFLNSSSEYSRHVVEDDKKKQERFSVAFESLTMDEIKGANSVLKKLFPRFGGAGYGSNFEEPWAKEKRIASKFYFDRYFSYAIPEGDVSDVVVEDFISSLSNNSVDDIVISLNKIVTFRNADNFILKLRGHEDNLPSKNAQTLGIAIAHCGNLFPNPEIFDPFRTAFSQAAILIAQLSHNILTSEERFAYAKKIVLECEPFSLSIDCSRWFASDKETPEPERKLSDEQEKLLTRILAERIKKIAQDAPIYIKYPKDSGTMLWIWAHGISRSETNIYLSDSFSKNNQNVLNFIKTYLPTAWGLESGLSFKGTFHREQYNSIELVVEPEIILEHLRSIFGQEIDHATFETSRFDSVDKTLAFRFACMYSVAKREKDNQNSNNTSLTGSEDSNGGQDA